MLYLEIILSLFGNWPLEPNPADKSCSNTSKVGPKMSLISLKISKFKPKLLKKCRCNPKKPTYKQRLSNIPQDLPSKSYCWSLNILVALCPGASRISIFSFCFWTLDTQIKITRHTTTSKMNEFLQIIASFRLKDSDNNSYIASNKEQ